MANFFSASQEEQQEILLNFWQKYKYLLVAALIIIALSIVGRDYFQNTSLKNSLDSASLYQEYIEAESNQSDLGESFLQKYPDSIYSDFVLLNEAKKNYLEGKPDIAADLLKSVIQSRESSSDAYDPIMAAAQTRLAKIYLEQENYEDVLAVFEFNDEMTSTMHELQGDAYNGLKKFSLAKTSFMLALQNSANQTARAIINMKISDLEIEDVE